MKMVGCGSIFLAALSLFLKATDASDRNHSQESYNTSVIKATIEPRLPLVWSGGFAALNCTLLRRSIDASARDLKFYSSNPEIMEKLNRTEIIDDLTIRAKLTDIHRNMSSANISCRFRDRELDEVTLFVADRIHCEVSNWESMTCTWEKFPIVDEANFSLIYSRSRCAREKFVCPNQSFNRTHGQCVFKKSEVDDSNSFSFTSHCFALKIQHSSGLTFKQIGLVDVKNLVKPNPVSGQRIYNVSSSTTFVNWIAPKDLKTNYRVSWISQWMDVKEENTTETWISLSNLTPNTNYTVTIDCIPVLFNGKKVGFWSVPKVLTFVTSPDVPGASPKVNPGAYLETPLNASHRVVKLFFQPPDERHCHGRIKGYKVKYSSFESYSDPVFEINKTSTVVNLLKDMDYTYTVEAESESGYNTSLVPKPTFIFSQRKKPSFPEHFVVQTDGQGLYFFSWMSVDNASNYTLYWCNSYPKQMPCLDVLQWKTFPSNQTSTKMNLTSFQKQSLRFFISVEKNSSTSGGELISSGMLMSNCTYLSNGEMRPPHNFHVRQGSSSNLIAEWSQPDEMACQQRAYAAFYVIFYCAILNCPQTNVTIKVNSFPESYEINGLEPGTTYMIMIRSVSKDLKESNFVQRNETTAFFYSKHHENVIVAVGVVVGILFLSVVLVATIIHCHSWWKEKFDIQVVVPSKYYPSKIGIMPQQRCYSNFHPSFTKEGTGMMADSCCDDVQTPTSQASETQTMLPRANRLLSDSSCYTNETTLPSSSEDTSKSDDSLRSCEISGYNQVLVKTCPSVSVTSADSGTSLPNSDSLSFNRNSLVFDA